MWSALFVGLLILAGGIANLFGPEPDLVSASALLGISACVFAALVFMRIAERKNQGFVAWILANAEAIQEGRARFGDVRVTPATVLTRYQAAFSFLIVTFKAPSRFYLEGAPAPLYVPALLTLATLVLGWWGIPWGPLYTVQVFLSNLRGGVKETVGDLLAAANAQIADAS